MMAVQHTRQLQERTLILQCRLLRALRCLAFMCCVGQPAWNTWCGDPHVQNCNFHFLRPPRQESQGRCSNFQHAGPLQSEVRICTRLSTIGLAAKSSTACFLVWPAASSGHQCPSAVPGIYFSKAARCLAFGRMALLRATCHLANRALSCNAQVRPVDKRRILHAIAIPQALLRRARRKHLRTDDSMLS